MNLERCSARDGRLVVVFDLVDFYGDAVVGFGYFFVELLWDGFDPVVVPTAGAVGYWRSVPVLLEQGREGG